MAINSIGQMSIENSEGNAFFSDGTIDKWRKCHWGGLSLVRVRGSSFAQDFVQPLFCLIYICLAKYFGHVEWCRTRPAIFAWTRDFLALVNKSIN
jgi:hypothetical protein